MQIKKSLLIIFCLVQAGCATNAQMQLSQQSKQMNESISNFNNCMEQVKSAPYSQTAYQKIIVPNKNSPNKLELLGSTEKLSEELKSDFISTANLLNSCESEFAKQVFKFNANFGLVISSTQNKVDLINVELLQKQISIGEYNKKLLKIREDAAIQWQQTSANLTSDLENRHYQEVSDRQRAGQQAYENYLRQEMLRQQQEAANQQSLRSSQPINTNCYRSGNYLNCTTR